MSLPTKIKQYLKFVSLANPIYLAKDFHIFYEKASKGTGWKTQEICQVPFESLPKENRETMVLASAEILKKYYVIKKDLIE